MVYIPTDSGHWVDENFERLARIIKEYDEYLELAWIPSDKRTREDKEPYAVIDTRINQPIFYARETDTPVGILARLIQSDNKNGLVIDRLEAEDTARKLMHMQEFNDKLAEAHEKANFLFNTPLHYVKMGKGIKLDETRRRIS